MTDGNPFKQGSRKAQIYDAFKAKGLEAAFKLAENLGIKAGTVKSWSGSWTKGTLPTPKAKGDKVKRERIADKPKGDDEVWFKYDSMFKANRELVAICKRAGLRPHSMHIIENEGRFAIVPISKNNDAPIPQFEKGDVVYDAYSTNSKARVIVPGPEQSEIRYDKDVTTPGMSRPKDCTVPNRFLLKLPDEPAKATKPKRERLGKSLPPTHPAIRGAGKAIKKANAEKRKSEKQ